jgi:hypothetical protein
MQTYFKLLEWCVGPLIPPPLPFIVQSLCRYANVRSLRVHLCCWLTTLQAENGDELQRQNMLFMQIFSAMIRTAYRGVHWEHQVVFVDRDIVLQYLWKLNAELYCSVLYISKHSDLQATVINRIMWLYSQKNSRKDVTYTFPHMLDRSTSLFGSIAYTDD